MSSVISNQLAFEPTKMCASGRMPGSASRPPAGITAQARSRATAGAPAPQRVQNAMLNARASGWVGLRRGRRRERLGVEELGPREAVPVLRRYYEVGRVTRPFFDVDRSSPEADWLAEAPRHPVFRLVPPQHA